MADNPLAYDPDEVSESAGSIPAPRRSFDDHSADFDYRETEKDAAAAEQDAVNRLGVAADTEYQRIKARELANLRVSAERARSMPFPAVRNLADVLAEPDPEQKWLVDRLWPANGTIAMLAQAKAGKTTLTHSLAGSLADGSNFLDWFPVTPPQGMITLIDTELDEDLAREWLRQKGIQHPERIRLVSAKGAGATLDVRVDAIRTRWAEALAGSSVVILDCVGPAMAAIGIDADHDNMGVRAYLEAFDQLKIESGASEALWVHHMGHVGEHARGASAFQDQPSVLWRLTLEEAQGRKGGVVDDLHGPRYLKAFGRKVDLPESQLEYDAETGLLTFRGGSRRDNKRADRGAAIRQFVTDNPGATKAEIVAAVHGRDTDITGEIKYMVEHHQMRIELGPKGSHKHWMC